MTSQPVVSRFRCVRPDSRPSLWAGVGRRFLLPLPLVAGILLAASPVLSAVPKALWVALDGREDNPGTKSEPLASFEAARDRLRELRRDHPLPHGGVSVRVRGGTYRRSQTFELTAEDSGTVHSPITYRNEPGETVILSGGWPIELEPLTDPAVLDRLGPVAGASVKVADLSKYGISDFGRLASRGFGRPVVAAHLELFFDGRPMTLARWPNAGQWATIAAVPPDTAHDDDHGRSIGSLTAGFHVDSERPFRWQTSSQVWVHGYWAWDWANSYERVTEFDAANRHLLTAPPHGLYGFRPGQRFYFLNVLEELDTPGEYYVDHATGRLYFWEPLTTPPGRSVLSVLATPLVRFDQAAYLTWHGLSLEAGRSHGIEIRDGQHVSIVGCRLRNLGNHAIVIAGGQHHEILSCNLLDTGDGGVIASGGNRQTLAAGRHLIENNWFQRQGRWSKCYVPAIQLNGVGLLARHNLIHDHPHCAILFGGNDHRIEFNEIHHVALETGDVGAIYTGRDWTYRGNRVVHNYIHETGGVGMGSMGVYLDDCVSGTEVSGNVFRRVTRAVFIGGGRDHRVDNNLFLDCHPAVAVDGRGLDPSPVWRNMVAQTMKDRLDAVPGPLYRKRYPALDDLNPLYRAGQGVPPDNNVFRRNISLGGRWLHVGWHATEYMLELKDNLVDQDPGFIDVSQLDLRLKRGASARNLGFKTIPIEKIGLYPGTARRELERAFP